MSITMPTKVTVDGVPRYVAYMADFGEPIHYECTACGRHDTNAKPYYYTDDNGDLDLPLCDGCVRGDTADPRFIWWLEAHRYREREQVKAP